MRYIQKENIQVLVVIFFFVVQINTVSHSIVTSSSSSLSPLRRGRSCSTCQLQPMSDLDLRYFGGMSLLLLLLM